MNAGVFPSTPSKAPTPEVLRRAMLAAEQYGMRFCQIDGSPALASITCCECGWPSPPPMKFVIEKYAAAPFGCTFCPPKRPSK